MTTEEQKEAIKTLVESLFAKDVSYPVKKFTRTDPCSSFKVQKVEIDENHNVDVLIDVEMDLDSDDFEYDQYDEKNNFNSGRLAASAQDALYRFLVNSGQLHYHSDKKSVRYKHSCYQIWGIRDTTYAIAAYHSSGYYGGPDYFCIDDDIFEDRINKADPQIKWTGEDDYEINIDTLWVPIWITIKTIY